MKKHTFEEAKELFEFRGYELLETEYINNNTKMAYICPRHRDKGVQYIKYGTLSQGSGCKYCGVEKSANTQSLDFETVKKAFEERGYELLETEYINSKTKMAYICNKHKEEGVQYITYNSLRRGKGCKYCAIERRVDAQRLGFKDVVRAFEKEGLTLISTENDYKNTHSKLKYICPNHPNVVQEATYNNVSNGHGCRLCKESKGEKAIDSYLKKHNIQYTREQKFEDCKHKRPLPFDFYLPQLNVVIEFDGEQHYNPLSFGGKDEKKVKDNFKKTQTRDAIKTKYCADNNIKLIRIPYWDIDSIEEILKKELNIY